MFKTAKDLKNFILWAKAEGVEELKVGDIAVKFSALATAGLSLASTSSPIVDNRTPEQIKLDEEREYNDILFHSTR